jgi:hypothetical protein
MWDVEVFITSRAEVCCGAIELVICGWAARGMADTYLGLFEHPELFAIADYFQINASHKLIAYDKATGTHTRTGMGAAYEIIRNVFEDAEIYDSRTDSTRLAPGLDAVSAEAVVKQGQLIVFAINKTSRSVPLRVILDDQPCTRLLVHRALSFAEAHEMKSFKLEASVLVEIAPGDEASAGTFLLPPLSLNRFDPPGEK